MDQSLYFVHQPISRLSDKLEILGSIQTLAVKWHLLLDSHIQTRFKSVLLIWHNATLDQWPDQVSGSIDVLTGDNQNAVKQIQCRLVDSGFIFSHREYCNAGIPI